MDEKRLTSAEMKWLMYDEGTAETNNVIKRMISPFLDEINAEMKRLEISSEEFYKSLQNPYTKEKMWSNANQLATLEGMKKLFETMVQEQTTDQIFNQFGGRSANVVELLLAIPYNEVLEEVGTIKNTFWYGEYEDCEKLVVSLLKKYDERSMKLKPAPAPACAPFRIEEYMIFWVATWGVGVFCYMFSRG